MMTERFTFGEHSVSLDSLRHTVVVIGLVFAICLQANGQEAPKPADSIVNPDIILRSTPQKLSPMQKAYEKLLLREMYERDKQDPRRVTVFL